MTSPWKQVNKAHCGGFSAPVLEEQFNKCSLHALVSPVSQRRNTAGPSRPLDSGARDRSHAVVTGSPLPQSLGDSHTSTSPGQPDGISLRVTSGGTGAQAWSVKPLTNVILAQSLISLHYFLGQSRLLVLPASISSH